MSVPNPKQNKNPQSNFLGNFQAQPSNVNVPNTTQTNNNQMPINNDNEWQDASGSEIAYLVKPNEIVTFTPLEPVKPVKNGQAGVLHAYVYTYVNAQGQIVFNNANLTLMVQKIPMDKIQNLWNMYGNKVVIKMINKGKLQGQRYYTYDIKYKVLQ